MSGSMESPGECLSAQRVVGLRTVVEQVEQRLRDLVVHRGSGLPAGPRIDRDIGDAELADERRAVAVPGQARAVLHREPGQHRQLHEKRSDAHGDIGDNGGIHHGGIPQHGTLLYAIARPADVQRIARLLQPKCSSHFSTSTPTVKTYPPPPPLPMSYAP